MQEIVGVSHECDFPREANERPRVTHCPIHQRGLTSSEVDEWVRRTLHEQGTIYTIDQPLLRELQPDVILHPDEFPEFAAPASESQALVLDREIK